MTAKTKLYKRVLSAILSVVIVLSALPFALTASAAGEDGFDRKADPSTLDNWQTYFYRGENDFDTSNAGGIWTDKSVLTDNEALKAIGIDKIDNPSDRGFLSVLSAIGSNMTVTGQADIATDTVLVLDTSGSMGQNDINSMVEATNITIKTLMDANPLNRVAVVFYSDSVSRFLPLDHYTTGEDGVFLSADHNYFLFLYTGTDIVLDSDVRNSNSGFPNSADRAVTGGTYTALGIYEAMNILTADSNVVDQTVNPCIPVVVLMTDGVPTFAHTDFTAPSTSGVIGDGNTASQDVVFATELTASYAKEKITAKYGKDFDCLFYTLGMGVSGSTNGYNEAVLDPVNKNSTALNTLWEEWDKTVTGGTLEILDGTSVTKIESPTLSVNYVDKYIAAATEANLVDAFKQVLDDISLQTTYYPTLVDGSGAEHSGYISFVDKIGRYMNVTGFGGLIINGKLYDGSHMAHAFFDGELGSVQAPTELGDNLIWSIKQRLNIDADTARALVGSAYAAGQLYYKDNGNGDIDFSNYFGWYSDADNNFLGFWSEGSTVPANAVYINKSYLYLGENDATTGVRESEMMYATIRIRETIATGEQEVDFAIPASLIPTVSYNIKLNEMGNPIEMTTNAESVSPIRLVYETELDSRINKWTAGEIVDNEYITHLSPEGNNFTYNSTDNEIYFYNNKWDFDGLEGYGTYNPYSYFRPSYENNRYYYVDDAYLWVPSTTVQGGWDLYRGASKPAANDGNTYYYGAPVYYKTAANTYKKDFAFERVYDEALKASAQYQGEDMWHIPAGYIRQAYANHPVAKANNETETLPFYASPYTDYLEGLANNKEEGHENLVGTTLGNNGKIILTPERGIKIVKELEAGVTATTEKFTFKVVSSNKTAATREAYKIKADGTVDTAVTSVVFNATGEATVDLMAGEAIYIGDMAEGETLTVTELSNTEYVLKALTVDGVVDNDNTASVTLGKVDMPEMVFTNGTREKASLNVSKHITHPYGTNYKIPDKAFNINLTMTLEDGSKLANYTFADGSSTNGDGVITVPLAHNESKLISGIPDGVKVQVTEDAYAGFTATFNETSGTANDGIVTVTSASSTAVSVVNDYSPIPPSIAASDITVKAVKNFGREWREGDTFTFVLEEEKADWEAMATGAIQTITIDASHEAKGTTNPIEVTFTNAFLNVEYTVPGTYYYRVIEEAGTLPGVNYDTSYHRFEVVVEDDQMDGTLNIKEVKASEGSAATVTGTYNVLATFNNGYSAEDAVANIQIDKHIVNNSNSPLATKQGFTFKVAEVTSFADTVNWNEITKITDATSETGIVKYPITFTRQDMNNQNKIYKYYKIKEVNAGATGWLYDKTEKNIVIEVSDVGGALVAKAYEYTEGTVNDVPSTATSEVKVDFTNTYTVGDTTVVINDTTPAAATVFVNKILSGRGMDEGEFDFVLYDEDNGVEFTTGTTKTDAADKESVPVIFEKALTFDAVGEYHFSIYEDTSSVKNGVAFDKTKYTFTVTVTDGGQGSLTATVVVDNGTNGNKITFTNTYKAESVTYAIPTAKKNYNREIIANAFSFYIAECDENGKLTGEKTPLYADNQGNIVFPTKTYTDVGENYYLIWENIPEGDKMGIAYDESQYLVKVAVADNTDLGKLEAALTVGKKAKGETTFSNVANKEIAFTNTYSAADAVVSFKGYKALEGTALTDGAYSFELYLSNAQWQEVKLLDTKANGVADDNNVGEFIFTDVAISENTNFIVKEKNDGKNGVTYDTAVYRVAVTVTDNGRGQLVPEVIVRTANGVPVDNISFTNKYSAEATAPLMFAGTKVLEGRDLENGEFKFYMQQTNEKFEALADTTPQSVENDANGKFSFSALSYEKAGKYYYVISEDTTLGTENVTFDNTKYYVTVTVTDNTDTAKLTAKYEIKTAPDATETEKEIVFTNVYAAPVLPETPKTGDNFEMALWATLLSVSGMAVLALTLTRKKEEEK